MSTSLGPKDLLYKPVVDSSGKPVGKVVNLTQNGSGRFEVFGVQFDQTISKGGNGGNGGNGSGPVFLDMELIETVDRVVRLKKRLEDLVHA